MTDHQNSSAGSESAPLPCPLCKSKNIDTGFYYGLYSSSRSAAFRCMECGCRAPKAAWDARITDAAQPTAKPIAWMNREHIGAYMAGAPRGLAWASPEQTEFYDIALYASQPSPAATVETCKTCNGRREVGGFDHGDNAYRTERCPKCAPQRSSAAPAEPDDMTLAHNARQAAINESMARPSSSAVSGDAILEECAVEAITEWIDETPPEHALAAVREVIAIIRDRSHAPIAFVPIHPRQGPLWSDTFPAGSEAHRSNSYPRMALYAGEPQAAREIQNAGNNVGVSDISDQQDVRWAVNVLLEKIAEKFEGWETMDVWRSDAAATVRSFKHDLTSQVTRPQHLPTTNQEK